MLSAINKTQKTVFVKRELIKQQHRAASRKTSRPIPESRFAYKLWLEERRPVTQNIPESIPGLAMAREVTFASREFLISSKTLKRLRRKVNVIAGEQIWTLLCCFVRAVKGNSREPSARGVARSHAEYRFSPCFTNNSVVVGSFFGNWFMFSLHSN